jgi:hypothetical protein
MPATRQKTAAGKSRPFGQPSPLEYYAEPSFSESRSQSRVPSKRKRPAGWGGAILPPGGLWGIDPGGASKLTKPPSREYDTAH